MFGFIMEGAHWLDAWLRQHIGRAYAGILGAGMAASIVASLRGLGHAMGSSPDILKIAGLVAFQLILLVNQLAQFHDYRQEAKARRAARRDVGRN